MNASDTFKTLKASKILRAIPLNDNGGFNPDKFLCVGNLNQQKRRHNIMRLNEIGYVTQAIDCPEIGDIFRKYSLLITLK